MGSTVNVIIRQTGGEQVGRDIDSIGSKAESAGGKAGTLSLGLSSVSKIAAGFVIGKGLTDLPSVIGSIVGAGSDMNETLSKSKAVFGEADKQVQTWAADSATKLGATKQATLEMTATFGNLFTTMGITKDGAASMSEGVVQLGTDLASFNNIPTDEALEKIRSGLAGEAEPLRSMGIMLTEAGVKAKAMQMGLAGANGELSESAKVQARYALIMEQSTNAQGDFAKTSEGLANQTKILKAEIGDLETEIGEKLVPAALKVTPVLMDLVDAVGTSIDGWERAFGKIGQTLENANQWLGDYTEQTEKAMAAHRAFEEIVGGSTSKFDINRAAIETLGKATSDYNTENEGLSGSLISVADSLGLTVDSFDDQAAAVKEAATQLAHNGTTTKQFREDIADLPPKLQEVANKAFVAAGGILNLGDASKDSAGKTEGLTGSLGNLTKELKGLIDTNAALEKWTATAKSAFVATGDFVLPTAISQIPFEDQLKAIEADGKRMLAASQLAGKTAGKALVVSFADAIAAELANSEMETEFGDAGGRVLEAFGAGLKDAKDQAAIAPAIVALIDEAKAAGVPNADALGKALIDAVAAGLKSGSWDEVYAAMHALADGLSPAAIQQTKDAKTIGDLQKQLAKDFTDNQVKISDAIKKEVQDLDKLATDHKTNMDRIERTHREADDRILREHSKNMQQQLADEVQHYQDAKADEDKAYGERTSTRKQRLADDLETLKKHYDELRQAILDKIHEIDKDATEDMSKAGKDAGTAFVDGLADAIDTGKPKVDDAVGSVTPPGGGDNWLPGARPPRFDPTPPENPTQGIQNKPGWQNPWFPTSGSPSAPTQITVNIDTVNATSASEAATRGRDIAFAIAARGAA